MGAAKAEGQNLTTFTERRASWDGAFQLERRIYTKKWFGVQSVISRVDRVLR